LLDIADIFFEMLEDYNDDFDFDAIDQLKKMFLLIDTETAQEILN